MKKHFTKKSIVSILTLVITLSFIITTPITVNATSKKLPSGGKFYQKNYYKVFTGNYSWSEAKEKCEKMGGHLVTITDKNEQKFIENTLNKKEKRLWIGAYRDFASGKWKWVTKEKFKYSNWGEGEPNGGEGEPCAAVWPKYWNDLRNDSWEQGGFICEWDNVKPKDPVVKKVNKSTGVITGTAGKHCTIYIKVKNATYSGKTKINGSFSIKTTKLKSGTVISIYSKNALGVKSAVKKITVY